VTDYLSFEWLKLSKRWMPRVIILLLLGGVLFYFVGEGNRVADQVNLYFPQAWLATLFASAFFAAFLWPVLGGSWAGNEYGWGTIRLVLTRRPDRMKQVLGALVVLLAAVFLALIAGLIVGSVAGIVIGLVTGHGALASGVFSGSFLVTFLKGLLAAWFVAAFYLIVAYAAAIVFRSAAVGIGVGLGSILAQFLLFAVFRDLGNPWAWIAQHFPIIYANALTQDVVAPGFPHGSSLAHIQGDPAIQTSLLALGIFMVILLAITFTAVSFRDVTD